MSCTRAGGERPGQKFHHACIGCFRRLRRLRGVPVRQGPKRLRRRRSTLSARNPAQTGDGQLQGAYRAYRAGDLDAARSGYAEVLQDYPDNRDAMLGLAACAVREGDLRSAASMYRRVTRAYPQDAWARAALAGLQGSRQGGTRHQGVVGAATG